MAALAKTFTSLNIVLINKFTLVRFIPDYKLTYLMLMNISNYDRKFCHLY